MADSGSPTVFLSPVRSKVEACCAVVGGEVLLVATA